MSLNPKNCAPGQEQYEIFRPAALPGQTRVQYDYRHPDGLLFSCVAKTLEIARARRDEWLQSSELVRLARAAEV